MKLPVLSVVLATLIAACGGDAADDDNKTPTPATGSTKDFVQIDSQKFCDTVSSCATSATFTKEQCIGVYGAIRVPPACGPKLQNATCSSSSAEIFSADCFPACGPASSCEGENLTACNNGISKMMTVNCRELCATQNRPFVRCGANAGGETKCLCE